MPIHQFKPQIELDYRLRILHNEFPGNTIVRMIGENTSVGTVQEDIVDAGGTYPLPTTAETLDVVSTDLNDTFLGTGGRTADITGLDGDFEPIQELVQMNGTTIVTTTATFMRVHQIRIATDGVYTGLNLGTITATNTTSGNVLATVPIGGGFDNTGVYTTAAGKQLNIIGGYIVAESNKPVAFTILVRGQANLVTAPFGGTLSANPVIGLEGSLVFPNLVGRTLPEKSDLWIAATTASGTAAVTVVLDMFVSDFVEGLP